jgi:glycosyltransferase involved in cell wall biosynthesis
LWGGGLERARLHKLARKLRLERVVHWAGDASADQLAEEYNRADVFCLPSVQEGFGIVFLEAMAARKPIIAARAAAVPEVVKKGLLTEPNNTEALAEAMATMYADSDLRNRLAACGDIYVKKYEMTRIAQQFLGAIFR